ncbi:MAG: hypothetical protein AAF806_09185, partial [Bacteroidota bacterium]
CRLLLQHKRATRAVSCDKISFGASKNCFGLFFLAPKEIFDGLKNGSTPFSIQNTPSMTLG